MVRPTKPIPLIDPLIGMVLGEYRIESVVGEGGMGTVYRGVHPVIGKQVAVKVLKASLKKTPTTTQRIVDEARAVNAIAHRNIIDIFGLGELPDGRPYVVMELLSGEPLDAYLHRTGVQTEQRAVALALEIASPLEAAHRAGVVHRDLKPGNVFLCTQPDGTRFLKLLDFGLARRTQGIGTATEQTSRASIVGTPNYLAPEQAKATEVSDRTDVYALGVMLFEFVTGEVPFTGTSPLDVAMAHVRTPAPSVRSRAPDVSPALEALIGEMLAKKREDRPSITTVRQRLLALQPEPAQVIAPQVRAAEKDTGRMERELTVHLARPGSSRALLIGGLAAVVVVLGVALWWLPGRAPGVSVKPPPDVAAKPPLDLDAGASPTVTPPTVVAAGDPPDAAVAVEVDAGVAAVAPAPVEPVPTVKTPRPEKRREVATTAELKKRLDSLEARLRRATPRGEDPDAAALAFLKKLRLRTELETSVPERQEIVRKLDLWERQNLR